MLIFLGSTQPLMGVGLEGKALLRTNVPVTQQLAIDANGDVEGLEGKALLRTNVPLTQQLAVDANGNVEASPDQPTFSFWGHSVQIDHGASLSQGKNAAFTVTPPSDKPYSLSSPNTKSYAQWGQDLILQPILQKLGKGFFVESGALDGEDDSNTLFYEKLGWTGLLVEPNPEYTNKVLGKHRKAYFFKGCLSPTPHEQTLHFHVSDGGTKGTSQLSDSGSYKVLAEPLQDLLQSIGRKTVDFWSLDIEGSEATVLKSTDFSKVEVGVLLIEMNKNDANNDGIKEVMEKEGFVDIGHTNYDAGSNSEKWLDHIFVNPKYFAARGLAVPTGSDLPVANHNS
jgi:hypothetical protein